MALSEDQLCELFADGVRNSQELTAWLLGKTKFAVLSNECRLLHEEQSAIRPRKRWWRHWWCHVPELMKDRETDIFMVFESETNGNRFALHIECKKDDYRFNEGQAASYAPRARHMLAKPQFLDHTDFATLLLAPNSFGTRFPDETALFDAFVAFEDVAQFLPDFATAASGRGLSTGRDLEERASRAGIAKADEIPSRAGNGQTPIPGDELPPTRHVHKMPDLADLFPGFASHFIDTANGRFFARAGGDGPPLLLLHGYPQTHVEWHKIAPRLAERFSVVAMDLRGYGWSSLPEGRNGDGMSKRALAQDAVDVMEKLGHVRFSVVGHDRGGRVAYRLAYDQPGRLDKVVVIDIVPTFAMFDDMGKTEAALKKYHWLFLAQPAPFPETLIGASARYYLDHALASWSAAKDLSAYDPRALAHYRAAFEDPSRIAASCEDYRAGALIDRLLDKADLEAGRKIEVPLYAMWGDAGFPSSGIAPLDVWRRYARNVDGAAIKSGHFVPEENPDACVEALLAFLR